MKALVKQWVGRMTESFWLLPAIMVVTGVATAFALLAIDRGGWLPVSVMGSSWLYNGGGTGARTLLGAIASSTIGVAGTVFSITIAALSLAAGQMGPRLLRNFTRDRGNQFSLGAFLGTFSYALTVLRSVRTQQEGAFTPHLALSFGMLLAFGCVATLVYFVGHMASRINVDTVIDLVSDDVAEAFDALVVEGDNLDPPDLGAWREGAIVVDDRRGYVQQLEEDDLAHWAAEQGTSIRLLVRRGDYISPGMPVAVLTVPVEDADGAIRRATALGASRGSRGDAEQTVRQLVEVAVRALSPGINDPHTAMSVLDRLGAALCTLAGKTLPNGVHAPAGKVSLWVPNVSYESLCDVMFHMIRQNAAGNAAVLIKLVDVLTVVLATEPDRTRHAVLGRHIEQVALDVERTIGNTFDAAEVRGRIHRFGTIRNAMAARSPLSSALLGLDRDV
ncbi:DUF2254 domain-containing protein [Luteibacter jiangsuensis]|uniref:DUF2254 domain-containing protein n=2 Tax=Luteibacter jiangsuensis TaxID=637577 RepID=A0ABX0Q729_9GAMM|nr:DUF2254 domain-containing protein [Luteibacter jiangsuensis]